MTTLLAPMRLTPSEPALVDMRNKRILTERMGEEGREEEKGGREGRMREREKRKEKRKDTFC